MAAVDAEDKDSDSESKGFVTRVLELVERIVDVPLALFDDIGATVMLFGKAVTWGIRPPYRFAPLLTALDFVGAGSTFIVALVGLFTGMAFTLSTVVAFRQFSAESLVGGVVALALARELAPVLAAVVVTARAGSTIASELGNMRVSEQIDAITTMGINPVQYLVSPRILATTLMLPLLALGFALSGMCGAYIVAVVWQSIDPGVFWDKVYSLVVPADVRMMFIKSTFFGAILSTIACKCGFYASGGARGVGQATARAVVASIVAIFAFDYVLTSFLTDV